MIRQLACPVLCSLLLVSCGQNSATFDPRSVQLAANGKTIAAAKAAPEPTPEEVAMIPFAGLWGRTPVDCDLSRDDRRGTLNIAKTKIDYYAAGGRVERIVAHSPTSVTVDVELTGFGKTTHARTTYRLLMGGTRLERTERSRPGRFVYTRC